MIKDLIKEGAELLDRPVEEGFKHWVAGALAAGALAHGAPAHAGSADDAFGDLDREVKSQRANPSKPSNKTTITYSQTKHKKDAVTPAKTPEELKKRADTAFKK